MLSQLRVKCSFSFGLCAKLSIKKEHVPPHACDGNTRQETKVDFSCLPAIPQSAPPWALAILAAYSVMRTIVTAAKRPFEFDEVLSKLVSRQHGLRGIWQCLNAGMDGQPLLYYVVKRAAQWLVPNEHVAYRLPSILAFVATMILLYIFVKIRSGLLPAFISATVLLMSEFSWLYAFQARPYMLPAACVSGAMVCYQRISSCMGSVGFFLSLVLASTVHFYAIFLLMAFCLAELAYVWQARKVRGRVWFALLVSPVPVVVCARILLHLNQLGGSLLGCC